MHSDNKKPAVYVIIPAFNESKSIGKVIADIPDLVNETIVVNNASTDNTETIAKEQGATVLREPRKGYGYSCLKGIDYLQTKVNPNDIIVFLDGDYSDFPDQISMLIAPILESDVDMVIGSRPFRAIQWKALQQLDMKDKTFGWTVEMQVKAAKHRLKFTEVAVNYRRRIGVSKVSGTIYGTIMAGFKIVLTIFKNI